MWWTGTVMLRLQIPESMCAEIPMFRIELMYEASGISLFVDSRRLVRSNEHSEAAALVLLKRLIGSKNRGARRLARASIIFPQIF